MSSAVIDRILAQTPEPPGVLVGEDDSGIANRIREHLLTVDQLRSIPPPEPLFDNLIDRGSLVVVHGAEKSGKTLLALDLALSISTGSWWQRHAVRQGPVVYVIGEGQAFFAARVDAWLAHHRVLEVRELRVLRRPINLSKADAVSAFIDVVGELAPSMVVFDTLARCTVGVDENSAREMGGVVASLDRVRLDLDATVMAVHHDNRGGTNMRGSSALDGALDTELAVTRDDQIVTVKVEHQRNHPDGQRYRLGIVEAASSVTLGRPSSHGLSSGAAAMLEALAEAGAAGPISSTVWMRACEGDVPERTFHRLKAGLVNAGEVTAKPVGSNKFVYQVAATEVPPAGESESWL